MLEGSSPEMRRKEPTSLFLAGPTVDELKQNLELYMEIIRNDGHEVLEMAFARSLRNVGFAGLGAIP